MTGLVIVLGLGLGLVQGLRLVVCLTADTRFIIVYLPKKPDKDLTNGK